MVYCMLRESNVDCFIGDVFVGALAYADDVTLLAPTPSAMRHLLYICEQYGRKFSIVFSANKSAWLYVTKGKQHYASIPEFFIDGKLINLVSKYAHLGHIISAIVWMINMKF